MKLIVNTSTGWLIDADDDVYVINTDYLNDDDRQRLLSMDISEIAEIARTNGQKLNSDTLELNFSNVIAFSEEAIKDEMDSPSFTSLDDTIRDWVINFATHEDFELIANAVLSDERIWEAFPGTLSDALKEIHAMRVAEGVTR